MSTLLNKLTAELKLVARPDKAQILSGFFKTGKGQYGEGDIFLGIYVPIQRGIAKKYLVLDLKDIQILLNSKIHEHRTIALFILIAQYQKADEKIKEKIYKFYLENTKRINNWDLVDLSAPNIVGQQLLKNNKNILYKLARSKNLWEKRIAIVATLTFIRAKKFDDTLKISEILIRDRHDLIHKAVGWMLREMGKRDESLLRKFLKKHAKNMPRTMLRYSIEKFNQVDRQYFLCLKS
ncbi:MAG: DNA alkylation repair protein [Candidatus Magasanikbacteria bacterium]|nr:DNA alkylation repair protein [Candidatus Magasanikbacteria bacterium]